MKELLIYLALIALLFISCKKSQPIVSNGTITATLNGVTDSFNTDSFGANGPSKGEYELFISGNDRAKTNLRGLSVKVTSSNPITTGTYPATLQIIEDGSATLVIWGTNSGTITINAINGNHVEGTFSGILGSASNGNLTITNGAFSLNNITNTI